MTVVGVNSWKPLRPGDCVRVVSPASAPSPELLTDTVATLESWGLQVQVGTHATDRWGFMAGRDDDRLADVNDAFRDPDVRAVIASRGGAGTYRIADRLDFAAIRRDPKPLVGFSDLTDLHLALWRECRLPTVHGCVIGEQAASSARTLLLGDRALVLTSDATEVSARFRAPGTAAGPLVGGNLSTIAHRVGAGLPDLSGAILLFEDERTIGIGRVDRQLTQLRKAGALDAVAGVVIGHLAGFDGYVDRDWSVVDVLADHLAALGVPVLGGLPIGHGGRPDAAGRPDQSCALLGSLAVLDADAHTLTVRAS